MAHHRSIVLLCAALLFATPHTAGATDTRPRALSGPEIIKVFEGKAVKGAYADGTPVRESYAVGGGIVYWDPVFGDRTGKWSVVNNLLCTFYDGMAGGCFRVEQVSANCFDYLAEASSEEEAMAPTDKPRYTARAAIEGAPSTCPAELSV